MSVDGTLDRIKYDMEAKSKWVCKNPECGVPIPYNPTYSMHDVLCSNCAAYANSDKLLNKYRWRNPRKIACQPTQN